VGSPTHVEKRAMKHELCGRDARRTRSDDPPK